MKLKTSCTYGECSLVSCTRGHPNNDSLLFWLFSKLNINICQRWVHSQTVQNELQVGTIKHYNMMVKALGNGHKTWQHKVCSSICNAITCWNINWWYVRCSRSKTWNQIRFSFLQNIQQYSPLWNDDTVSLFCVRRRRYSLNSNEPSFTFKRLSNVFIRTTYDSGSNFQR